MKTALTELTGVEHPIVQTGMGWVAGPRLVSATANAGALGILASATMTTGELRSAVREVRSRTDRPFGVNLRADAGDARERVRIIVDEGVRVASFALAPSRELIAELKDAGVVVIPSVGARRHAEKVAAWGADAVLVQGGEGGGHTGEVATTVLLPQVVDAVGIPVIAAGGFHDGRGLVAALAYGAAGIAMGTRFLLTSDSTVPDAVKARYLAATVKDVTVTTAVDGLPHRMLRTDLVAALERAGRTRALAQAVRQAAAFRRISGLSWTAMVRDGLAMRHGKDLSWSQVLLAANTPMLLKASMVEGRTDLGVMASGQVAGVIEDLPSCAELVTRVMSEAAHVLRTLPPRKGVSHVSAETRPAGHRRCHRPPRGRGPALTRPPPAPAARVRVRVPARRERHPADPAPGRGQRP
ncbi:nitronate monooxygenase [Streptomyces roseicoloratus]|uniref:Nitronate monooxygenase n=1 Tax=Streptomyces roseicoloratus TaxID=2508722 RepID=A0ABY9S7R9_9ACTN|nr:nitronate monooxygenase [Streptomyces roseicoloratus]WMX49035.1 nitronate monooxygenase [Streptomyces roseicoloratus]